MTGGDSPLLAARKRLGWSQAAAMRRFRSAATQLGCPPPEGASLRRMFAYWEAGAREVGVEAYRQAFCLIYQAPAEALGFVDPPPVDGPESNSPDAASLLAPLVLTTVDAETVQLLNAETHQLRLLDRRLGSTMRGAVVDAHCLGIEDLMHRCVDGARRDLAAALVEAATLAGWLALDRDDITSAWRWHEMARSAAREAGSDLLLAHVMAQQSVILTEAGQPCAAVTLAGEAAQLVGRKAPPVLRSWLTMSEADALATIGEGGPARARMRTSQTLLKVEDEGELPFLMLSPEHLARWVGHCLTRLDDPAAVAELQSALPGEGDSLRAAAGLRADLAESKERIGDREGARHELELAKALTLRCDSARHRKRIVIIQRLIE